MSPVLRYSVLIGSIKRCPTCEIKLRKMLLFKIKSLTLHSKYINNVYITIMLESLTLKNFLSFRDETIFDFTATTEKPKVGYEHIDWYTPLNKKKILKTIFLFGNNGAGKSNFLNALTILRMFILNRRESKSSANEKLPSMQFRFESKCRHMPSHISVVFHINKIRYTYVIEWDSKIIHSEILKKQSGRKGNELVFERSFDAEHDVVKIVFPDKSKLSNDTKRVIRENVIRNTTVISVYDNKNFEAVDIAAVHRYFEAPLHFYGLEDERLELCSMLTRRANAEQIHDLLIQMLNCVGSNIQDYKVDTTRRRLDPGFAEFLRKSLQPEEFNERYPDGMESVQYLRFAHYNNDKESDTNDPYIWLTEGEESHGTLNMIRLMIILIDAANANAIATIDECAMGIHQETFNRIIQFYLSISTGSQVFLATQALPVLDMEGFRRDTARFFDKDFETGVSHVESINLRKFHANKNIYKNYVDHAFGGKPTIPSNDEWITRLRTFHKMIAGEEIAKLQEVEVNAQ